MALPSASTDASTSGDGPAPDQDHGLTPREIEVLRLLAAGRSNPAIAEALFISPRTAQTHVQHILDKLDVSTRAEAAAKSEQDARRQLQEALDREKERVRKLEEQRGKIVDKL